MNFNMKSSGRIVIDGREFSGRNVSITGNKVTIDGVVQDGELQGDINIQIYGDVDTLDNASGVVKCYNVGSLKTMSGDVECGDISGNVKTMSGNVTAKIINGSSSTMSGDIRGARS